MSTMMRLVAMGYLGLQLLMTSKMLLILVKLETKYGSQQESIPKKMVSL
jgi:hypothetical protein